MSSYTLVVTEKPSVARDIAAVLGARQRHEGYLQGAGHIVTWALGHLVALPEPHQIDADWRHWRADQLPMLPDRWPLVVLERSQEQFAKVAELMTAQHTPRVVCATDAGREGELIFRYIYEKAGCRKPVQRMWISSLTKDAIRAGLDRLQDASAFDDLAAAAKARSRADWLVGMNFSRAYTLALGDTLSVGRVQTPTLALVVERDRSIESFVPEDYLEVMARFSCAIDGDGDGFRGMYLSPDPNDGEGARASGEGRIARLAPDGERAKAVVDRAQRGTACIAKLDKIAQRTPPPLLYDLTELQRHANRLYGLSANRTLEVAQALYERHKLISYPRTDSRHLSPELAPQLPAIVEAVAPLYEGLVAEGSGERSLGARFIDQARVTDHHAIIPTPTRARLSTLSDEERKLYDLVARRFLAAWHDDHVAAVTTVITEVHCDGHVDRYRTRGSLVEAVGHRVLEVTRPVSKATPKQTVSGDPGVDEQPLPAEIALGRAARVLEAKPLSRRTRPPRPLTEATLLTAMETAGRSLDDKELSRAMRERGLGTPATRAAVIETLLGRGYLQRDGKALRSTPKGRRLVDAVHERVRSPALTGEWESRLKRIERGEAAFDAFMRDISDFVREVVGQVLTTDPDRASPAPNPSPMPTPPPATESTSPETATQRAALETAIPPIDAATLSALLHERFGHERFRPHQQEVCEAVAAGKDVLVVMPTGAGKSLCFQLPGIARGGTTLVLSPLIALMEDQVAALQRQGIRAERIHSGRDRAASRRACVEYLSGRLDFLFIAPERLKVPGFPEMLAKRKPTLIAIDEAHCISHWGHDFRPDYRMLKQRLPLLRPAPIVALTATATPTVQDDIVAQLGIPQAQRYIYGFRRTNIAIEAVEAPPGERAALVGQILGDEQRVPAIVYAPTRKEAERLAELLTPTFRAAAYHAGMDAAVRESVQSAFQVGNLDVIVATIAFGMGIDKPDVRTVIHAALPSTIEGYYQEIGRAGRDGLPSRAVLMHAYADQRTQTFFFTQSYPEPELLETVFGALSSEPQPRGQLAQRLQLDEGALDAALDKLWVHGGALVDAQDRVRRGQTTWRKAYRAQRKHRQDEMDRVLRFAQSSSCRMLQLVQHFGDQEDDGSQCEQCDVCDPQACCAQSLREVGKTDQATLLGVLGALAQQDGQTPQQLARACLLDAEEVRALLAALVQKELVTLREDSFDKQGRTIRFQRVELSPAGMDALRQGKLPEGLRIARPRSLPPIRRSQARADAKPKRKRSIALSDIAAPKELVEALRQWRLEQARKDNLPAFRILTDRVLAAVAVAQPSTVEDLATISGMGATLRKRYGDAIVALIRDANG